ncbi:Homocysteine S-methyltransferase 1 [Podochytrium sp. JEL0797]|nr:Homocysteine S-methyltransferase 1 [Podochytrium sp. JEL0797]
MSLAGLVLCDALVVLALASSARPGDAALRLAADCGALVGAALLCAALGIAAFGPADAPRVAVWLALLMRTGEAYSQLSTFLHANNPYEPVDIVALALAALAYAALAIASVVLLPSDADAYERLHQEDHERESAEDDLPEPPTTTPTTPPNKESSWKHTWTNMRRLFPFLFPKDLYLRSLVAVCLFLLLCGRVVNVIVPFQYKMLVDAISEVPEDAGPYYAWGAVLTFCFLRYLQSGVGLISSLQSLAWIPVAQFNTREINVEMLRHLHSLSLQFHINRKTGEVLRVMDRGNNSVASLLSAIVFNIGPVFIDIGVAVVWFMYQFDILTGSIIFTTMALYIFTTVIITDWRTKYRREMNTLDSASRARAVDSLLNFETVKYYNNEAYEVDRFAKSIDAYQVANWKSSSSLAILNTAQNTIITVGLLAGCMVIVRRVVDKELTVGDFIMFITYVIQLYQPLNFFGTYYRAIQQNFIDMESMFELLNENPGVVDTPGAKTLECKDGQIEFENVSFHYDSRQPALQNISFTVPAKTTTALVGQSGSGKSTLFRLLFRFYDPQQGRILIDGQDIKNVTQHSLRKWIGVVPQDTVCFNDTIAYNIGYGDVTKSVEEIEAAAAKAQIHERIVTGFPDGYETKVGERGLRLSGGEKQRVAIARTLLKDPKIILLDEATSALDNTTEALIQRSLTELTSRRTTLVIAHRLSTVTDADCILVMREGRIVERGTHKDLVAAGEARAKVVGEDGKFKVGDGEEFGWVGAYWQMWMREIEEEDVKVGVEGGKGVVVEGGVPGSVVKMKKGKGAGVAGAREAGGYHGGGGGGAFH